MNIVKLSEWTDEADEALRPVTANEHHQMMCEVNDGISELYCIDGNSWLITRIDGDELVVCCYIGENVKEVAAKLWDAANAAGCKYIRFHTQRPGLNRMMREYNFECMGLFYIYRREI